MLNRLVIVIAFVLFGSNTFAEPTTSRGRPVEVTLYRGQAQVTRLVEVPGGDKGPVEIVVTELPAYVISNSLFAEGSEGIDVRAVRYRARAVDKDIREEVQKLDEQIKALAQKMDANRTKQQVLQKRLAQLDALEKFTAGSAKSDTDSGKLNAEAIRELVIFNFEQREQTSMALLELQQTLSDLQEEINLVQRKRSKIASNSSKTVHEAQLFLERTNAGKATVRLTYLVNNCGWSPGYNLRANRDKGKLTVEYNAVVTQMSGEDWERVQLTLSTATPALASAAPGLAPFEVALQPTSAGVPTGSGMPGAANQPSDLPDITYQRKYQTLLEQQKQLSMTNQMAVRQGENIKTNWDANANAGDIQALELNVSKLDRSVLEISMAANGPSLTYQLDERRVGVEEESSSRQ